MMENALSCIFKLADNPILLVEKLTEKLIDQIPPFKNLTKVRNLFGDSNSEASEPDTTDHSVKTGVLSRFFSFIGFLATKLLIFLNQTFVCELKRRKMCKESQKQNQLDSTRPMSKTPSTASSKSKKRKSIRPLNSNDNALEEEMGLQGAELMFVDSLIDQKLAQTQTHGPNSMLAQLLPTVVHVLKEPLKYSDDTLQLACSLALVKLMLLSPRICNQYLQLLFTLVEKSNNPLVRSQLYLYITDAYIL